MHYVCYVFRRANFLFPTGKRKLSSRPKSGSMLLYSRKKVRYRRDGYCWKKRKDGKTTREDHMKLKVQGTEVSAMLEVELLFYVRRKQSNDGYGCRLNESCR